MGTQETYIWIKRPNFFKKKTKYESSAFSRKSNLEISVKHHRAIGMVEKTVGSIRSYVLFEKM